jgi:two-component system chemotaxis response regulator CheY
MKTVMVVDDSRLMRNMVKNAFGHLEIEAQFLEAEDGVKAIKVLEGNSVDLIFLDWNMPHLSGIDFLRKVRAIEKYQNIPIIMVTSEASKESVVEAVKAGVTAYIAKPFSVQMFVEKLSHIAF